MLHSSYRAVRAIRTSSRLSTAMASFATHAGPGPCIIDPANNDSLNQYIEAMTSAFERTALTRAFSSELKKPRESIDRICIRKYVDKNVRGAVSSGATLVEAGNFSAIALWEGLKHDPADEKGLDLVEEGMGPLRQDFIVRANAAKQRHVGRISSTSSQLRPHYHLEFLGRNPDVPKVNGAITSCVKPFLDQAQRNGLVVWLEATTRSVVSLYEYYGFQVVEKIIIEEGLRSEDGELETGGPGIPAWGMIYDRTLPN